jgi:hypothetical protein
VTLGRMAYVICLIVAGFMSVKCNSHATFAQQPKLLIVPTFLLLATLSVALTALLLTARSGQDRKLGLVRQPNFQFLNH